MSSDSLRRTRRLSVAAVILISMWMFGNLYEAVVTNAALLADPRPGSFPDEFAAGSPFYYYVPWGPLGVAAMLAVRVRFGGEVSVTVRRYWNFSLAALGIALAVKIALIVGVNPALRDPGRSAAAVGDYAVLWALGNGLAVLASAAALALFAVCRRPVAESA
ncbi:MAG: hypothetical protein ACRD0P_28390 [Stackebrandtia sp.]